MEAGKKSFIVVQSLVISYIIAGIILCILAFLMYQLRSGDKIANVGITITYIISSVLAGAMVGKKIGKRKFVWGLITGMLYFLILLGVSLLIHENTLLLSGEKITVFLLCTAGGMLGGMIA
ncbi:hypothetical protein BHF70_04365 [Anaerostipes sp. 494a]|uniref:TIGR04086 family membrane protein n=1 Tax=Anaerostipes sp. 494a TaxID=1261636 RepID=UPI0009524408|nr:TIGR04086 family membrane protein [Anaerostipes sp. 494a]OLR58920.1 hypothetical protein BHF70_04365 [Anaerostipes sp. 494a]